MNTPQILIVDDEQKMRHLLSIMLESKGYTVKDASDGAQAWSILNETGADLVITDIKMPKMDGNQLLKKITDSNMPCPVVFITAFATVDSAVEAMQQGAVDYITKPFEEDRILLTVERALSFSRLMNENWVLRHELKRSTGGEKIVYQSEAMACVMEMAQRVARTESAVLVMGESGTGKELLARFIHQASPRSEGRFVPINCAAISPHLVESELFGHEKGAFTGADRRSVGKFEYADGGTLFLDEIGDLPLEAQAKLLRALQEKRIQRVGGNDEILVDVRVVCATNRKLESRVESGDFRQDLYYRVNVFPILMPPLRERLEDVILLAEFFLKQMGLADTIILNPDARGALIQYHWPGNVRELANAMERAAILTGNPGEITKATLSFLSPEAVCVSSGNRFRLPPHGIQIEKLENDLVNQAMEMVDNNQTAAAKLLGVTRAKFRVLLKQAKTGS